MTTNVAVPRTCPGQRLLPAVLGSLHSGRGEGQRVAEASPQPFARWPPTAHVAPPSHGCSGCRGGRVMLTRRSPAWALLLSLSHPSHLSTGLGRRDSPQNRVPASAGWAERSPVGWPHRSWELMPEPPVGPSSGGHAKPLLQPQGLPGKAALPITAPCDFRQAAKPPAHCFAAAARQCPNTARCQLPTTLQRKVPWRHLNSI